MLIATGKTASHNIVAVILVLAIVTCTDRGNMMDAPELPEETTPAALDRAPAATSMKEDERHDIVIAILDKLIAEHPDASGSRINLDGMFGDAYRGETVSHAGQNYQRVSNGTKVEKDTYTITFQDLKLTATNEAELAVGMLHADADGSVQDHVYDVFLVRDGDGVWSADLTHKGHFDGVLEGS